MAVKIGHVTICNVSSVPDYVGNTAQLEEFPHGLPVAVPKQVLSVAIDVLSYDVQPSALLVFCVCKYIQDQGMEEFLLPGWEEIIGVPDVSVQLFDNLSSSGILVAVDYSIVPCI